MRRPSITFLIFLAAAIYIVWVALTVGELWPFQRMFEAPPEFRQRVMFKDFFDGTRVDISPREAHLLWVIRDPEPADGTFDVFSRNFGEMLRRASPLELPVVIPLDLLMSATGESFDLIRSIAIVSAAMIFALVVFFAVVPIAVFIRRRLRTPSRKAVIAGIIFSCTCSLCSLSLLEPQMCFFGSSDELSSGMRAYLAEHAPSDPVITIFDGDSRFAHFAATQDLRLDNRIDLGQRAFSVGEIEALIGGINDDRVWLLYERGEPYLDRSFIAVLEALDASGRGFPFLRGPSTSFGDLTGGPGGLNQFTEWDLSDYWQIRGYDVNSDVWFHRALDIPTCWSLNRR